MALNIPDTQEAYLEEPREVGAGDFGSAPIAEFKFSGGETSSETAAIVEQKMKGNGPQNNIVGEIFLVSSLTLALLIGKMFTNRGRHTS